MLVLSVRCGTSAGTSWVLLVPKDLQRAVVVGECLARADLGKRNITRTDGQTAGAVRSTCPSGTPTCRPGQVVSRCARRTAGVHHTGWVPGPLVVTSRVTVPETELSWRFSRSSGPGGQGVNTTDSRAELSVDVTRTTALPDELRVRALARLAGRLVDGVLTVAASEHRSQLQNREAAEQRLAQLLREAAAPPPAPRRPTRPTRGSKERRLQTKRQRSDLKASRRRRDDD